jgi:4-amino-4-deoxy-L-arabinose transferase-like glycosyltransferase
MPFKLKEIPEDGEISFFSRRLASIVFCLIGLTLIACAWLIPEAWRPTEDRDIFGWMGVFYLVLSALAWKYLDPLTKRSNQKEQPHEIDETEN